MHAWREKERERERERRESGRRKERVHVRQRINRRKLDTRYVCTYSQMRRIQQAKIQEKLERGEMRRKTMSACTHGQRKRYSVF